MCRECISIPVVPPARSCGCHSPRRAGSLQTPPSYRPLNGLPNACVTCILPPSNGQLLLSTARYCNFGFEGSQSHGQVRDLYAEGFVPTMSADERGRYYGNSLNLHGIEEHISALQRADALLLVYPTWWFSLPAMLKGWFDRVWVPGVAFRLRRAGGLEPLLMSIRRLGVVTTYGSPRWLLWFIGWPDRRMVNSAFRSLCARGCRLIGLH